MSVVHDDISCDGCGMLPIVGTRYQCLSCTDADFCDNCVRFHTPSHRMLVFKQLEEDNLRIMPVWKKGYGYSQVAKRRHPIHFFYEPARSPEIVNLKGDVVIRYYHCWDRTHLFKVVFVPCK